MQFGCWFEPHPEKGLSPSGSHWPPAPRRHSAAARLRLVFSGAADVYIHADPSSSSQPGNNMRTITCSWDGGPSRRRLSPNGKSRDGGRGSADVGITCCSRRGAVSALNCSLAVHLRGLYLTYVAPADAPVKERSRRNAFECHLDCFCGKARRAPLPRSPARLG